MTQNLVSIIVISYNHARFIIENLNSLKSQTYKNWELIVADDASTDNSVEVFNDWLDENRVTAKKIYHLKNTGLATVLNEATELCSGKYVKFIAADDFMHPDCLEKSVKELEEKGEEYGMVYTDTFCVSEDSSFLPDFADYNALANISRDEFKKELIKANRIAALTVLMKTAVLKETGIYDSKVLAEDYFRWLKINEKYLIAYIPQKLSYYRWHQQNMSHQKRDLIIEDAVMLQIKFDRNGFAKDHVNRYVASKYYSKKKLSEEIWKLYKDYPYKLKRLQWSIKYNIHPFIYRVINKFI